MTATRASFFAIAAVFIFCASAHAELTITALNQTELIDFEGFGGTGLAPGGGGGTLDSDTWELGIGDGAGSAFTSFGDTIGAGDFGRGVSPGGVSERGFYAFEPEPGNRALGVQIGSADFSFGVASMQVRNETGFEVDAILVSFDAWVYNDSDGSIYFDLEFTGDNGFIDPVLFDTPLLADATPGWEKTELEHLLFLPVAGTLGGTLSPLQPGDSIDVGWSIGGGFNALNGYDEVAVDNIRITAFSSTAIPEPHSFALLGAISAVCFLRRRR